MNEDSKLYEDNNDQITLTLEDGSELICDVLAIFPVDGKDYIALLPQGDDPDAEIFLYRFEEKGEEEQEDDDLLPKAVQETAVQAPRRRRRENPLTLIRSDQAK